MTIWVATGSAAGRAIVVAIVATLFGWLLYKSIRSIASRPGRLVAWGMMIAVLLTPAIVVGYAYAQSTLALVGNPALIEIRYTLLLILRYSPVAALTMLLAPPPLVSDAGRHCFKLLNPAKQSLRDRLTVLVSSRARNLLIATGIIFLLVMQEFEIASLMVRPTWTVWLYDAQAGGQQISTTLMQVALPMLIELAVLSLLLAALTKQNTLRRMTEGDQAPITPTHPAVRIAGWLVLVAAVGLIMLLPAGIIVRQSIRGAGAFTSQNLLLSEIGSSIFFAFCGAWLAAWASKHIVDRLLSPKQTKALRAATLVSIMPGLLGSLVVGLLMLRIVTLIRIDVISQSVLPLIFAIMLLLMPMAVLLYLLVSVREPASAIHQATLLGRSTSKPLRMQSREIWWQLQGQPRFAVMLLLVFLGFFDLAASALLYPPSMMPVSLMLYNQMHYGHIPVLFAMLGFAVIAPIALLAATAALRKLAFRYLWL